MKKIYQKPDTFVVRVAPATLIAESPLNVTEDGDTYDLGDGTAPGGADGLVKGNSGLWGSDDWDE